MMQMVCTIPPLPTSSSPSSSSPLSSSSSSSSRPIPPLHPLSFIATVPSPIPLAPTRNAPLSTLSTTAVPAPASSAPGATSTDPAPPRPRRGRPPKNSLKQESAEQAVKRAAQRRSSASTLLKRSSEQKAASSHSRTPIPCDDYFLTTTPSTPITPTLVLHATMPAQLSAPPSSSSLSSSLSLGSASRLAPTSTASTTLHPPTIAPPLSLASSSSLALADINLEQLLRDRELKRQRLARKAELARRNRNDLNQRIDELQLKTQQMTRELEHLRAQNAQAAARLRREAIASTAAELKAAVADVAPTATATCAMTMHCKVKSEVNSDVSSLSERHSVHAPANLSQWFADCIASQSASPSQLASVFDAYLRGQESALRTDLAVERFEGPLCLRFLDWLLTHVSDRFYDPQNERGLWSQLLKRELQLTPDQVAALLLLRVDALRRHATSPQAREEDLQQQLHQQQRRAVDVSSGLRHAIDEFSTVYAGGVVEQRELWCGLQKVLAPHQLASYVQWVQMQGREQMQMLDEGVGEGGDHGDDGDDNEAYGQQHETGSESSSEASDPDAYAYVYAGAGADVMDM